MDTLCVRVARIRSRVAELGDALQRFLSQRRGVAGDRGFACPFDMRHPLIERRHELSKMTHEHRARSRSAIRHLYTHLLHVTCTWTRTSHGHTVKDHPT